MSLPSTRRNRAAKMMPRRTILYLKLNPEVDVSLSISFTWLRQSNVSLHSLDVVQSVKRTGLDNLNVVVFQVAVGTEKATLRVTKKMLYMWF